MTSHGDGYTHNGGPMVLLVSISRRCPPSPTLSFPLGHVELKLRPRQEADRVVLHATWTEAGAGGGTKLGLSAGSAGCGVIDENVDCGDGGARLDAREKVCWVWPGMAASNEIHEIQGCLRRPQLRTAAAPLAPVAASHRHLTPEQVRKFTLRVCPHTTQLECVRVNLPAAALWSLGWWACEQARVQPGRPAHGSYSTRRTRRMTTPAP